MLDHHQCEAKKQDSEPRAAVSEPIFAPALSLGTGTALKRSRRGGTHLTLTVSRTVKLLATLVSLEANQNQDVRLLRELALDSAIEPRTLPELAWQNQVEEQFRQQLREEAAYEDAYHDILANGEVKVITSSVAAILWNMALFDDRRY